MSDIKRITDTELNALAQPIPKRLVKSGTRQGKTFSYVTARTVMNRLDEVLGRANWKTEYRIVWQDPLTVECTLSVKVDSEWVGKADVGTEENYSPQKAAYSNALKRAGAQWGIARELYGEGNVYEEDEDDHVPASQQPRSIANQGGAPKSSPARPPAGQETATDPLEAITWTRDKARLSKLVDWAENEWQLDSRAHTINRLAKALGIQGTPNGDFNLFADMMGAQYTQSDADAMKAVKLYESAKPTPGAELFPREDDAGNIIETGACVDCGKPTDRRAVDGTWRCEACATKTAKKRKAG